MIGPPDVTSLYVLLAFGITCWILKKYLFGPLAGILESRERDEREAQAAHAQSLDGLSKAIAAGEEELSDARREALKTREGLRGQGMAVLEQRLAEARAAASDRIGSGSREIEEQAAVSERALPAQAKSLARELAEKILGRNLAA